LTRDPNDVRLEEVRERRREECINNIEAYESGVKVLRGQELGESANPNLKHVHEFLEGLGKSLVNVLGSNK